ncbi:MAG: DNA recombination protein RmuC [Methylovirgula sp.]|jgi:DNA recombination protein RmuC
MDHSLSFAAAAPLFELSLGLAAGLLILAAGLGAAWARRAAAAKRDFHVEIAELIRANAELSGRVRSMGELLGARQTDLAKLVAERLDAVGARVGRGLEDQGRAAGESLAKLNERLAVIDAAQTRLTDLTAEVIGLKEILANKQARGAFGQGRMEAIIRDALPASAYAFQHTLSNRCRPDCVLRLPDDERLLVIDAKFPLESFVALKEAAGEEAQKQASARVRTDVGKHIRDIEERYFLPGETQDVAILFVPSESLYGDLAEHFEDIIQRAHRSRIIIVSPSLLVMAVQVLQAIVRDARVREQAHEIQVEVRRLVEDVERLRDRVSKLVVHFGQAQEDLGTIAISAEKIAKRGDRIENMDFASVESRAEGDLLRAPTGKAAE